jgi:hypothetical protein
MSEHYKQQEPAQETNANLVFGPECSCGVGPVELKQSNSVNNPNRDFFSCSNCNGFMWADTWKGPFQKLKVGNPQNTKGKTSYTYKPKSPANPGDNNNNSNINTLLNNTRRLPEQVKQPTIMQQWENSAIMGTSPINTQKEFEDLRKDLDIIKRDLKTVIGNTQKYSSPDSSPKRQPQKERIQDEACWSDDFPLVPTWVGIPTKKN